MFKASGGTCGRKEEEDGEKCRTISGTIYM